MNKYPVPDNGINMAMTDCKAQAPQPEKFERLKNCLDNAYDLRGSINKLKNKIGIPECPQSSSPDLPPLDSLVNTLDHLPEYLNEVLGDIADCIQQISINLNGE